ncbi:uncharacterized protein LOC135844270 [Planococcus citri]|uniref:uncharacterized protein LOC135844270 n=1 Tax=Planococcus citri TaxID=170843 RepID=UPI0031F9F1F4
MSDHHLAVHKNLKERIDDLIKATYLERTSPVSTAEAKIYYDHLTSIYERMVAYELKIEATISNYERSQWLLETRIVHRRVVDLKVALQKIISSAESTSPTVTKVDDHSIKTEPSETEKKLDFHIRQQIFLIRQIESLEIPDDICAVKAEVMYNHLSQLYNSFISNQMQTEARVDDGATLENQQKIAKEIQQKVIDFQTKLKKIMQPIASTSTAESKINIDHSSQPTQTDTEANLDSLVKKRESLIERISSLKPEEELSPEKAEIMYNHLNSLYDSFNSNQTEIESQVSGSTLDSQLETSKKIQNEVIDLQTTLKKIFAPIVSPALAQFEISPSEQIKSKELESNLQTMRLELSKFITSCNKTLESHENGISRDIDILSSMNDHLKISKEIQTQISSLQITVSKFVNANERREKITFNKLDKNPEKNGHQQQDKNSRSNDLDKETTPGQRCTSSFTAAYEKYLETMRKNNLQKENSQLK